MSDLERGDHGRFPKGKSGNPKGRPRKDRTVSAAILEAANATVTVTENGKRRKIRKVKASATQIANKGAAGDIRAGKLMLEMAAKAEAAEKSAAPVDTPLSQSDQEIVEAFLADFLQHVAGDGQ